ncbi:MAG TPA: ComEC/Rec2 family competence protein, partial [Thermoanaerobaculia bacterium]
MTDANAKPEAAPAALAAIFFIGGILLGARAVTGSGPALALAGACALLLAFSARRGARGPAAFFGFAILWASLGFLEARARIQGPAEQARRTFGSLSGERERSDRIEGVLTDFWSGSPPHVRGRMRAERLWSNGAWHAFPAEVYVFLSGEIPAEAAADRGDRVIAAGHVTPEDVPPSERDISLPWPSYRLSVKSAALLERRGATALSLLTLPNRWLHSRLPRAGTAVPAFDRDVRGPLSALLLGRIADIERGMVARYRRGGLYHLLVVAGLHVALAGGLVMFALRSLRVRGKPRDAAFLAAIFVFVLVGGGNAPAVRAGTVFGLHRAARLLERP